MLQQQKRSKLVTPTVIALPTPDRIYRLHDKLSRIGRKPVWVIHLPLAVSIERTLDAPCWTARMSVTVPTPKPTRFVLAHETLRELRELLPPGLARLERQPDDNFLVVERWA
mgnify:CR=1 FL=1